MIMQCVRPLKLETMGIEVPCGKCKACRISKASEWSARLIHESEYYTESLFITLTYSDECLPYNANLEPKDLELFWKRLRKKTDHPIKYFACGEYGEIYGRPHYHAIVFGLNTCGQCHSCAGPIGSDEPKDDCLAIRNSWKKGIVDIGYLSYQSGRYVANYVLKSQDKINGRTKPFLRMSKGLGKQWAISNWEELVETKEIRIDGVTRSLPKYYVDLIKKENPDFVPDNERKSKRRKDLYDHYKQYVNLDNEGYPRSNINNKLTAHREQIRKNLDGKDELMKRRGVKSL